MPYEPLLYTCPNCGSNRTTVRQSKERDWGIRRYRSCHRCKKRFVTRQPAGQYERFDCWYVPREHRGIYAVRRARYERYKELVEQAGNKHACLALEHARQRCGIYLD